MEELTGSKLSSLAIPIKSYLEWLQNAEANKAERIYICTRQNKFHALYLVNGTSEEGIKQHASSCGANIKGFISPHPLPSHFSKK